MRDLGHPMVAESYPEMPSLMKEWKSTNAFFKQERGQINIGLGNGKALDIFNSNIQAFKVLRP